MGIVVKQSGETKLVGYEPNETTQEETMSKMMTTRQTTSMRLSNKKKVAGKKAGTGKAKPASKKFDGRPMYLPDMQAPEWLDGSMIGDRGFDPLGLSKPVEFLQVGLDELDQNAAINKAGGLIGTYKPDIDSVSGDSLSPYSEAFGLQRFRECELIHGRWCMLATLGILVAESATGVSWVDAGKVELDGARYLNFELPFSISQLCWFEAIAVGGAELYRNGELDPEKRLYPGGAFDPLGFATAGKADGEQINRLREAEIKHGRLAMVAFFGFGIQALTTGEGALGFLAEFSSTL